MGYQSSDHRARLDFWHTAMVAVFLYFAYISYPSLGIVSQSSAHADRIQYYLDLYQPHGSSSKLDQLNS